MASFQDYADRFLTVEQPVPQASWASGAAASFAESWEAGPLNSMFRAVELAGANAEVEPGFGGEFGIDTGARINNRSIPAETAKAKAKEAAVEVDFGTADYTPEAVKIMIDRAVTRKRRQEVVQSSGIAWGTQLGVGFAAGVADPINLLAAFIPVAPGAMLARIAAAETIAGRAGARALVGTVEGATGAAIVEPLSAFAKLQEGQDYGVANALQNIAFGAAFGATVRPIGGGIVDVWHSRVNALTEYPDPPTWADVTPRLDQETQYAALRQAADDLINGNPVSSSEVIVRAAAENPELARGIKVSDALRRDGPEIDDIAARQDYWMERLKASAVRKVKDDAGKAEDAYTKRMRDEAKVAPKTTHRIAARKIAEYEREIHGAERVHADPEPTPIAKLDEIDETQLTFDQMAELESERAFINEMLAKETTEIDIYAACLFGEIE